MAYFYFDFENTAMIVSDERAGFNSVEVLYSMAGIGIWHPQRATVGDYVAESRFYSKYRLFPIIPPLRVLTSSDYHTLMDTYTLHGRMSRPDHLLRPSQGL